MNWQHFQAFVWLRWRLLVNQWRRGGTLNAVLMTIIAIGATDHGDPVIHRRPSCSGCIAIPKATPVQLMYVWDGLILGFFFFWGIGLVTELQRTEPLSLSKFLHLPVSVNGAFLINYLSSLVRLSLIVFGPVMLGFSLALIWSEGISQLLRPAVAGGISADDHGADLSIPGLAGLADEQSPAPTDGGRGHDAHLRPGLPVAEPAECASRPGQPQLRADRSAKLVEEMNRLNRDAQARKFDAIELLRRQQELMQGHQTASQQADREIADRWEKTARLVNMALPVTGCRWASRPRRKAGSCPRSWGYWE